MFQKKLSQIVKIEIKFFFLLIIETDVKVGIHNLNTKLILCIIVFSILLISNDFLNHYTLKLYDVHTKKKKNYF
jgi:hypothetical protein